MSSALALWPVKLTINTLQIIHIIYINKYVNIYYIRQKSAIKNIRGIWIAESEARLCSSLSSGFDFVEFTVKKNKLFYDSIERIVVVCLSLSQTLSVGFFLISMPKPIF